MTCKELHDYWESDLRVAISLLSDSAELAEHVATCPKCDLFITERKELEKQLHLVSSAGPEIPPSLDNAVLANYRRYMAERPSSAVSNPVILRTDPENLPCTAVQGKEIVARATEALAQTTTARPLKVSGSMLGRSNCTLSTPSGNVSLVWMAKPPSLIFRILARKDCPVYNFSSMGKSTGCRK